MRRFQAGYTLIELVIVIVVLGITVTGLFMALSTSLLGTATVANQDTALTLAQSRMALIMGQFEASGFAGVMDPCQATPSLPVCAYSTATGYTVTSTITDNWQGNANEKLIAVDVTGAGSASLENLVTNYPIKGVL